MKCRIYALAGWEDHFFRLRKKKEHLWAGWKDHFFRLRKKKEYLGKDREK